LASDIQTVRNLCGDRVKKAVNEVVGQGDGTNIHFQLDMYPMVTNPTAHVYLTQTGGAVATGEVTFSASVGMVTFTSSALKAGNTLLATYDYHALSSGELTDMLSGLTGKPLLAASKACLILAADATRLFMYTMGDKTVDKRRVARDLMELSKTLENKHYTNRDDVGTTVNWWTAKDNSGTIYDGYDSATAYLGSGT